MKRRVLGKILSMIAFLGVVFGVILASYISSQSTSGKIPRVDIYLNDATVDEIDEDKYIKFPDNTLSFDDGEEKVTFDNVTIRGRGNSTWICFGCKKPYRVDFEDDVEFLDLGRSDKWVLLANYSDGAAVRNDLAYYLARELGDEYIMDGDFVELYVDSEYRGLYYLTPNIGISKDVVDLKDPLGIIVEMERFGRRGEVCYDINGACYVVKDVVSNDHEAEAMADFAEDFAALEDAAEAGEFDTVREFADVDSLVRYFLLTEFSTNPDGYASSAFFYKDGPDDKIHAGPAWDFDLAFGNKAWGGDENFNSPYNFLVRKEEAEEDPNISKLYYNLIDIPEFRERVMQIFDEKMSGKAWNMLWYILKRVAYIKDATDADWGKWNYDKDFEKEVAYLINYVLRRYSFFEEKIDGLNAEVVIDCDGDDAECLSD